MAHTKNIHRGAVPVYAIPSDFCRIFAEDMNGLYWLAFLLTADRDQAEKCFVSGFEDCVEGNGVFKEWARSWARRSIVQNALRMMQPAPEASGALGCPIPAAEGMLKEMLMMADHNTSLAAILRLKAFERFVFVMSVLLRYSDQDCKAMLGCTRQNLIQARARAMRQIGAFGEARVPDVAFNVASHLRHEAA